MFESKTYEVILDEMLQNVDDGIDTREGSVIRDMISPVALECAQLYSDMDWLLDETFADTASYHYLIKRAAERGIFVILGDPAYIKIKTTPDTLEIANGTRFNIGTLNYAVTSKVADGEYIITCETGGTEGNNLTDDVIPIDYISGLESAKSVEIVTLGTDDEDVEHLRNRYFSSFSTAAFGGNQAYYKQYTDAIVGVGATRVIPTWNGGGTVKIVILDNDLKTASNDLIKTVQNKLDPPTQGSGLGIAPIGHVVTVTTPTAQSVNFTIKVELEDGYEISDIEASYMNAVDNYFTSLHESWENEDSDHLTVRASQLENVALDIKGVIDVLSISIDGATSQNLLVPLDKIPVRGAISIVE